MALFLLHFAWNTSVAETSSPEAPVSFASRQEEAGEGIDAVDDNDLGEEDEAPEIEQFLQELFVGNSVYPQDRGEWQFTSGFFHAIESTGDGLIPFEIEYGITDRFQCSFEAPAYFPGAEDDSAEGITHVGGGVYYTPVYDAVRLRGIGVGYDFGAPVKEDEEGERSFLHEPYIVFYQLVGQTAFNFSAGLEITDPLDEGDAELASEFAVAAFRRVGRLVPLIELGVEVDGDETPLLLSPGVVCRPRKHLELGVATPIGLNDDAPEFGAFGLVILEFGGVDDDGR